MDIAWLVAGLWRSVVTSFYNFYIIYIYICQHCLKFHDRPSGRFEMGMDQYKKSAIIIIISPKIGLIVTLVYHLFNFKMVTRARLLVPLSDPWKANQTGQTVLRWGKHAEEEKESTIKRREKMRKDDGEAVHGESSLFNGWQAIGMFDCDVWLL